jgi:hypothetical protein
MLQDQINGTPERGVHSWNTAYAGEPVKGALSVFVNVWIPREVIQSGKMADYIEEHLGWKVHRNGGWGGSGSGTDELTCVYVKVRAREIRAAMAVRHPASS